jgi:hypothetical protein
MTAADCALDPTAEPPEAGRWGTAWAPEAELRARFGPPHIGPTDDGKVTLGWLIRTPAGVVELRDYHWNKPGEWSLAGHPRAVAAAVAWLSEVHGLLAEAT